MAAGQLWEVVGGADKGGIVVRAGRELSSQQLPRKLNTAARVEQLSKVGDRLRYRLLDGDGPEEGWVSVKLKDKVLLEPRAVAAPKASPSAAASGVPPSAVTTAGPAAAAGSAPTQARRAAPAAAAAASNAVPVAGDSFETRLEDLRERFPGFEDPLPADAADWAPKDLENFFESGGFIKPKAAPRPAASAATPASSSTAAPATGGVPQLSVSEATQLQDQLRECFKAKDFQDRLLALQRKFPKRKQRGHPDTERYFEAFEPVVLGVYSKVLPRYRLEASWDGVHDMYARMVSALTHPKVKQKQEELNLLLNLPRDAVLRPARRAEEAFVYRPDRDGGVQGCALPLVADEDGDEAHEFFVEDRVTGELRLHLQTPGGCKL